LLALLLAVYAGCRALAVPENMARAQVFTVLVLCNLALIHANRTWSRASWHKDAARNRYFGWIMAATVLLLAGVLGFAPVSGLFAFERPTAGMLAAAVGLAGLGLLWFEGVKWAMERKRH
jgi:Ca2+-transporting ATPase